MDAKEKKLRSGSRIYISIVIFGLAISGITAFPLETELAFLTKNGSFFPDALQQWLSLVYNGLKNTNQNYPFLSYGGDWLAFAHIMLAILFIGPLKNPLQYKWIIEFGMMCCLFIIPLALTAGSIRQIPLFWRLIDCSFGIFGIIPLFLCYLNIKKLEALNLQYELYI